MAPRYESVFCYQCAGTGVRGRINTIGVKSVEICKHCKGVGRRYAAVGSYGWIKGKEVIPGLGKRIKLK